MSELELVIHFGQYALGLVVGVTLLIAFTVARRRRLRAGIDQLARRTGGTAVHGGVLEGSRLYFRADGVPATLTIRDGAVKLPEWTRIRFDLPLGPRVRVLPSHLNGFRLLRGEVETPTGDAPFDRLYRVGTEPGVRLDPAWRRLLAMVGQVGAERGKVPGAGLDVGPSGIMITCYRNLLGQPRQLEGFFDTALELFREIRGLGHPGIQVSALQVREAGICPVCGHAVAGEGRRCVTCRAAHHEDCWEYFGGCSIYGCKSQAEARVR